MTAYYNELDPFAAAWLRELIKDGQIAPGEVDERDIREVQASDLRGFVQHHWFAGIGGWSLALRLAGWPDDRPVWTGSCPCQPFSSAGAGLGGDDPRHLWPAWFRLIRECRPDTVFGEQVEAAIAHGWLDLVCDDLEGEGYATGAVSLPACSVGAFHIRQRLWWVANARCAEQEGRGTRPGDAVARLDDPASSRRNGTEQGPEGHPRDEARVRVLGSGCRTGGLAIALHPERGPLDGPREDERDGQDAGRAQAHGQPGACGEVRGLGHSLGAGLEVEQQQPRVASATGTARAGQATERGSARPHFWANAVWLPCRDGKARPVEPSIQPLAHGIPNRVGLLRGAGNAIVPELAAAFIQAVMEVL